MVRPLALAAPVVVLLVALPLLRPLRHPSGISHDEVLRVFAANIDKVRDLLIDAIGRLPGPDQDCGCRHALDGQQLPFDLP